MLLNSCDRFLPGSEWIAATILQWCSHLLGIELSRCVLGVWVPCIFLLEIPERLSTYNRVLMTTQAAKVAICFKHLYMLMEHAPHTFPVKDCLPSISFKLGMQFIISSRCPVCVYVCMYVCYPCWCLGVLRVVIWCALIPNFSLSVWLPQLVSFIRLHQQVCPMLDGYSEPLGEENLKLGKARVLAWLPNTQPPSSAGCSQNSQALDDWTCRWKVKRADVSDFWGKLLGTGLTFQPSGESRSLNGFSWPAVFTEVGEQLHSELLHAAETHGIGLHSF